jgi:hypothetical protein
VVPRGVFWSLPAWAAVGVFWFVTTRDFHPTTELAVIVTASLVLASALAAYANHLVLVPRYWRVARYGAYGAALFGTMAVVTAAALAVIRLSYFRLHGLGADPYGAYKHFAIDFFGVAVHVAAAAGVVWAVRRIFRP